MPKSRALPAVAAAASIALASLLIASPAHGATLPSGQRITVIDNSDDRVYDASPATAALAHVGPGFALELEFATAVDVDEDGHGYALFVGPSLGFGLSYVAPLDATTGVGGELVPITIPSLGNTDAYNCSSLDLFTDGVYYTICGTNALMDGVVSVFGALDPVKGELDVITTFEEYIQFTALASNPKTGAVTAFEYNDSTDFSGTWVVNPADWSFTTDLELDQPVLSADSDRDGQLFVTTVVGEGEGEYRDQLATLDAGGTFGLVGDYTIDGAPVGEFAIPPLTVWGKPALPATGAAMDGTAFGLGAALLLLVGAAAVLLRRRSA